MGSEFDELYNQVTSSPSSSSEFDALYSDVVQNSPKFVDTRFGAITSGLLRSPLQFGALVADALSYPVRKLTGREIVNPETGEAEGFSGRMQRETLPAMGLGQSQEYPNYQLGGEFLSPSGFKNIGTQLISGAGAFGGYKAAEELAPDSMLAKVAGSVGGSIAATKGLPMLTNAAGISNKLNKAASNFEDIVIGKTPSDESRSLNSSGTRYQAKEGATLLSKEIKPSIPIDEVPLTSSKLTSDIINEKVEPVSKLTQSIDYLKKEDDLFEHLTNTPSKNVHLVDARIDRLSQVTDTLIEKADDTMKGALSPKLATPTWGSTQSFIDDIPDESTKASYEEALDAIKGSWESTNQTLSDLIKFKRSIGRNNKIFGVMNPNDKKVFLRNVYSDLKTSAEKIVDKALPENKGLFAESNKKVSAYLSLMPGLKRSFAKSSYGKGSFSKAFNPGTLAGGRRWGLPILTSLYNPKVAAALVAGEAALAGASSFPATSSRALRKGANLFNKVESLGRGINLSDPNAYKSDILQGVRGYANSSAKENLGNNVSIPPLFSEENTPSMPPALPQSASNVELKKDFKNVKYEDLLNVLDPVTKAQIQIESSGKVDAVSPKGARSPMQLMPATAKALGIKNIDDPVENVMGGMNLMGILEEKYGDLMLALAAYNHGEGNVDELLNKYGEDYQAIQPHLPSETRNYVSKVINFANG